MDPRIHGLESRKSNHSRLMLAQKAASKGERVNLCPYGCKDHQIDDQGYCRHLVGFTLPDDPSMFETIGPLRNLKGEPIGLMVQGNKIQPVLPSDHLERVTVSYRVYRKDRQDAERKEPQPAQA